MRMKIRNITGLVLAALSAVCINGCVEEMDIRVTDSEQISFFLKELAGPLTAECN